MRKSIPYYFITFSVGLLISFSHSHAQVIVQFTANNDNNFNLQTLWNFQVNNLAGYSINSYIDIKVTNNRMEQVVSIQSPRIELANGINNLNNDIIKNARINYNPGNAEANILKKEGYFSKGLYYICISIKDSKSDAELGENCTQANVSFEVADSIGASGNKPRKENFFTKNFRSNGYSEVTAVYSNIQQVGSLTSPSYVQWYLNPTVSVFDFPVSFQLLLSSRQNDNLQNINSFNVQFDANQFMNMLKQRAMEFVKRKINNDMFSNMNFESLSGQLSEVKTKLENPGTLMELKQIKELDSLKGSLSNLENFGKDSASIFNKLNKLKSLTGNDSLKLDTAFLRSKLDSLNSKRDSLASSKIDSLKKKIKVLSWLENKKPYYDKLLKQKEEIESKIGAINMDSLTGKVDEFKTKYDPQKFNDPKFLYSFLDKFKLFKKFEKVMMAVKKLAIGTSYPNYTDFTCRGVQVNGLNIEIEKWNTYISFSYGNTLEGIIPTNFFGGNAATNSTLGYTYKRNVIGGSFGYGSKEKSHIHFTMMSFEDDPTSITIPDSLLATAPKPKRNQVMGVDFKVQLFKNRFSFYGELAGAQTVRDVTLIDSSYVINGTNFHDSREWFPNIFLQRDVDLNTSVDFAFKGGIEGVFFKGTTKVSAQVKRVGPGYTTLGNPFMMKDMFNIEARVSQAIWKKRITMSGFLRRNIDNLENTKLLTSQLYNFGFDFSLNIPKWPTLKVSMTPYVQSNDSTNMNVNVVMANSSYMFRIKKSQLMFNLCYMHQNATSADSGMSFTSHYVTLLNTLLLGKSVSLNMTQNYFQINNRYGDVGTYSMNLSGSIVAFKRWNSTVGATVTANVNERRYGGYYQTSIQFLKYFTMNLRVEYNRFDVLQPTAYNMNMPFDQVYLRGVLTTRW